MSLKPLSREWFYIKHHKQWCSSLRLSVPVPSVHPPSSFSKPSEPHNGPPLGTVYFAPSARSYRSALPYVHLPAVYIQTLIHPSGLTGAVPLGDAHLSPLMRAPSLMQAAGVWATERGRKRMQCYGWMQGADRLFSKMDHEWIDYKTQKQNNSAAASSLGSWGWLEDFLIACKCNFTFLLQRHCRHTNSTATTKQVKFTALNIFLIYIKLPTRLWT